VEASKSFLAWTSALVCREKVGANVVRLRRRRVVAYADVEVVVVGLDLMRSTTRE